MSSLAVDVFSDVICPWCFIGTRRLDQAIERLASETPGGASLEVSFRPFLLDPSTPPEGADLRERLRAKYGADPETMFSAVESAARSSGIPLDFAKVRRTPSTIAAHTLLRHARTRGTQHALAIALFEAYFLGGKDIGDRAELGAIAEAHGFARGEAEALAGDEHEREETLAEAREATELGIRGVPFFVFDARFAISGAQPVAVLREAIDRALRTREDEAAATP